MNCRKAKAVKSLRGGRRNQTGSSTKHTCIRPIMQVATAVLALTASATVAGAEVSLRDWLVAKGAAVADCVTGEGNASIGPAVLFDGVTNVLTEADAKANRWLANQTRGATPTAYATIAAPDSLFGGDVRGLVLRRYRLWRYSDLTGEGLSLSRAPVSWIIYGSNDGSTWEAVHEQSETADWREPGIRVLDYVEFEVPESGRAAYRQFKFKPTRSFSEEYSPSDTHTWQEGMMELELFVTEAAPVVNLHDWLAARGVTVADCVSGTDYSATYDVRKLFDGEGMGVQDTSMRWLGGKTNVMDATATIAVPAGALPPGKKGLALEKIRLWRNINGDTGIQRAPTTWVVSGSADGVSWTELQRQDDALIWNQVTTSFEIAIPENDEPLRFFKFQPLTSSYDLRYYTWGAGLQELEYFVSEVAADTIVVRGSLGEGVGVVSTGYGCVGELSAGDTLTIVAMSPSYAGGVKYEATGYTVETSSDGGVTWGAATSHVGTSATVAYDGTPTRVTWLWSPIAYRLDAHADEGNETVTVSPASADGYYAAGTALSVTATGATSPTVTTFAEWDVLPDGSTTDGATACFAMPAAPAEANARFARPWTYVAKGGIAGYPAYSEWSAVTDGNWLFTVSSRGDNAVSADRYFNLFAYVEGSGRLDLSTIYADLANEGRSAYPMRGVWDSSMCSPATGSEAWKDGRPKITSVVVPGDIWDVEGGAFANCPNLASVVLGGSLEKWGALSVGTAGAFRDCPELADAVIDGATALPHNLFAGCVPEIRFVAAPPSTVADSWADDWQAAVGCTRASLDAWKADSRFTALAETVLRPNSAKMVAKYGKDLIGAWNGKWLFRYGEGLPFVMVVR